MAETEKKGLNISAKSFITAIIVILILMICTYALSFIIPGGEYARTLDDSGRTIIDTSAGFKYVEGGMPFWKWLLSPFLVLGSDDGMTLIAVIIFLLVISGVFNALGICGLMEYMLKALVHRFGRSRYKLMAVVMLFFMLMGSFIGSFEECVPMVPIVTALAVSLGWDAITGLAMCLLAVGCGFAAGVCNPFTVGVAQSLAGLPMFSGLWLRALAFVLIYALLLFFVRSHAKKIDRGISEAELDGGFVPNDRMSRALRIFVIILGLGILLVLSSGIITALQDYTMIIVAVMFLIAGVSSALAAGMKPGDLGREFFKGAVGILPAVLMIMMASSIKFTLEESKILDTLLHYAVGASAGMSKGVVILFIYLIVLVMNFFIASGSAKAFLLMPLIVPMAQLFGLSAQLCVVAYAFGDGFSNVFYPTNPVLLISLGLSDVSYGKWARWTGKFQLLNLLLTSLLLLFGLAVGY